MQKGKSSGDPYQIYHEVVSTGKNVQGSKKKVRWLIGFTDREGELEIALIHSMLSGKKTIYEDGREISSSTNRFATDFGHTWRSEKVPGRLFRVEFVQSMTTDPTEYIFAVDGIKFSDMPKGAKHNRSSGFGTGGGGGSTYATAGSAGGNRGSISGFGSNTASSAGRDYGKPDAPQAHTTRRYIYDDDNDEDDQTNSSSHTAGSRAHGAPAAGGQNRASFQSPSSGFGASNANNNSGFGFDPFGESPAPAPKQSAAANLFNAFDEPAPAPANKGGSASKPANASFDPFGSDPFGSSNDPFASHSAPAHGATATKRPSGTGQVGGATQPSRNASVTHTAPKAAAGGAAAPNFLDDDVFGGGKPPAGNNNTGFAEFGSTSAPARRSSALEISQDFAGLNFKTPTPPKSAAASLFDAPEPEPETAAPAPEPEPESNDPWSAAEKLVNLDLSGRASLAGKQATGNTATKGPSLSSLMTANPPASAGNPAQIMGGSLQHGHGGSFVSATPLMPMNAPPPPVPHMAPMGGAAPLNPWDSFGAPQPPAAPMMMGGNNMNMMNSRASFTMGAPGPAGGMGGMGGVGMGGGPAPMMGGNAMGGGSMMGAGMGGMGGGAPMMMGGAAGMQNTRGSFISANPSHGGAGYAMQSSGASNPPKSSLDSLDWRM